MATAAPQSRDTRNRQPVVLDRPEAVASVINRSGPVIEPAGRHAPPTPVIGAVLQPFLILVVVAGWAAYLLPLWFNRMTRRPR
jgi:hypothetical protein